MVSSFLGAEPQNTTSWGSGDPIVDDFGAAPTENIKMISRYPCSLPVLIRICKENFYFKLGRLKGFNLLTDERSSVKIPKSGDEIVFLSYQVLKFSV